jgi:hypothetical protein
MIPAIQINAESASTFSVGFLSTAVTKFLIEYLKNKNKPKDKKHILRHWVWDDYIFIILGGLFTFAMNPLRIQDAILYGASWDAIFVKLFVNRVGGKNDDKGQKR